MTQNTLGHLNNHLFEQLERLNDEELSKEDLLKEINRAKAISSIASQIIANGNLVLRAQQFEQDYQLEKDIKPRLLNG